MKHQCLVDNMKVFHTLLLYSRTFPFISVTIQADWKVIGISDWIFKKCPKLLIADHYTYTLVLPRNTKQNMAIDGQVCFHRWLLPTLSKHQGELQGLWTQWMILIRMWVMPDCSQQLSCPILWIESVSVTYWRHGTAVYILMEGITCLWLPTYPNHPSHPFPPALPL